MSNDDWIGDRGGRRFAPTPSAPRRRYPTPTAGRPTPAAASNESSRRQSARLRGGRGGRAGGGNAFDASGYALGELLGMYQNSGGSYVGGTPGYTISRAGERGAAQGAFNRAEANRKSNYLDIDQIVRGRNPEIRAGYQAATNALNDNARKRALETRAALMLREQEAARAAAEMGLTVNPGATGRAGEVAEGGIAQTNSNAAAWEGFNSGAAGRAVERNEAVGDSFRWDAAQQQGALANMLAQLLAGMQDQYVAGTAGRMVGGLSSAQKLKVLGMIDDIGGQTFKQELDTTKVAQAGAKNRRSYGD